jgi:uncharacterized protein
MYIERHLLPYIQQSLSEMPIVTITGPRQSGKTTLAQKVAPNFQYVNLENLDEREFATEDPRGFLARYGEGTIIDEIQNVPTLFSYLQTITDSRGTKGQYILTGSQQFSLLSNITQSLAGRTALYRLLPLSIGEVSSALPLPDTFEEYVWKGGYPRIYSDDLNPTRWLNDYVQTYIERDVRQIQNIRDLRTFTQFTRLLAGRVGQLLNINDICSQINIDNKTAKSWLSVLEASYIIHILPPHFVNFDKRIVKTPKLYFLDTGLACALLNITSSEQLETHYARGAIFENWIITEVIKNRLNQGMTVSDLYFWRDSNGDEMDLIIGDEAKRAVEIKASQTIRTNLFESLNKYKKLQNEAKTYLVYGGTENRIQFEHEVVGWKKIVNIF